MMMFKLFALAAVVVVASTSSEKAEKKAAKLAKSLEKASATTEAPPASTEKRKKDTTTAASSELTRTAARTLLTEVAALMNAESSRSGIDLDLTKKVALYGLFTQATKGDAPKKSPYSILDFEGGVKFQSWESFKGKSPAECVAKYKKIALEVFPNIVFE